MSKMVLKTVNKEAVMSIATCPLCGAVVDRESRRVHLKRKDRSIDLLLPVWACRAPAHEAPYRFLDLAMVAECDEIVARRWMKKFDESLPAPGRPGRKPGEKRIERVQVLLAPNELRLLDQRRQHRSRSAHLRRLLLDETIERIQEP